MIATGSSAGEPAMPLQLSANSSPGADIISSDRTSQIVKAAQQKDDVGSALMTTPAGGSCSEQSHAASILASAGPTPQSGSRQEDPAGADFEGHVAASTDNSKQVQGAAKATAAAQVGDVGPRVSLPAIFMPLLPSSACTCLQMMGNVVGTFTCKQTRSLHH